MLVGFMLLLLGCYGEEYCKHGGSSEPGFLFDSLTRMRCVRPMPTYSVPGLIDHF